MKKEGYIFRKVIYLDSKGKEQCQFYRYKRKNINMFALYIAMKYFDNEIVSAKRVPFHEMDFVLKNTKEKYIDFILPLFFDEVRKLDIFSRRSVSTIIFENCLDELCCMLDDYFNL